eukprot:5240693-Amphidinium_carterae.1
MPLRELEKVLMAIKDGQFGPNLTTSQASFDLGARSSGDVIFAIHVGVVHKVSDEGLSFACGRRQTNPYEEGSSAEFAVSADDPLCK